MKNLSLFSLLVMIGMVLFVGGCAKESEINSQTEQVESPTLMNSFSGSIESTPCNQNDPTQPEYRIKVSVAQKQALQNIFVSLDNSGKFQLSPSITDDFGNPITKMALLFNSNGNKNVILPLYKQSTKQITSFFVIDQSPSGEFTFNFINREHHNHYQSDVTLKNRPSSTIMAVNEYYFDLFDYGVCNSNAVPPLPEDDVVDAIQLCEQEQMVGVYIDCNSWAIKQNETENRTPCLAYWEDEMISVPCPQSDSGGTNGGDTGSGWNGDGPGPTGTTTGTNSGNSKQKILIEDLLYLSNWMNSDATANIYAFLQRTDMSDDCLSHVKTFKNLLKDNNFSEAAIKTANCMAFKLSANFHPSAPDDCNLGISVPVQNMVTNMANMPSLAYELNSALGSLPCRLADTKLTSTQINNLLSAIDNFIPNDAELLLDSEGNPIPNNNNGTDYAGIANQLINLLRSFPELDFNQTEMAWLLNNNSELLQIRSYLYSRPSDSAKNLGIAITNAYTKFSMEEGNQIYLGSSDPTNPIYDIMSEMLFEAIKEQLIDIIPGMTFATIAPQFAANVKDGNWLEAMDNALTIVLNEGDALFPAVKIASVGLGLYTSGKQIKRVFEVFDKMKSVGSESITKLYNVLRNKLNMSINNIRQNFRFIGGINAKLDNQSGNTVFMKMQEEFNAQFAFYGQRNKPVFKTYDIPNTNQSVYIEWYDTADSGWNQTIVFYIAPNNATSYSQLGNEKFKIRFDY